MGSGEQGSLFEEADIDPYNETTSNEDEQFFYKVEHEIHRLMGFLRFSPDENGIYIARCEPDYFILPDLGEHFQERFGKTPWAIIDERRHFCLRCLNGTLELFKVDAGSSGGELPGGSSGGASPGDGSPDSEWEDLWRQYHKTINNESRSNPKLQRQFMPKRYWKYLTELQVNSY